MDIITLTNAFIEGVWFMAGVILLAALIVAGIYYACMFVISLIRKGY